MKKKAVGIFGLCILAAISLAACGGRDPYDTLNKLIAKTPSSVELHVTITMDGETLNSEYAVTEQENGYRVVYTYERLSTFDETEDGFTIPDSVKTLFEGSIVVKDGKIVEQNGAEADLSFEQMTAAGVKFDETYFSNAMITEDSIKADVKDPAAFFLQELECTNMKMETRFTEEAITSLLVNYVSSNGAQVVIEYLFT